MAAFGSYLLCGTPRTGSTLLCSLLTSTGVAGVPESYFREPDQRTWAARFGLPIAGDGSFDYRDLVAGALRTGRTPNGVFAARVMWGTMHLLIQGLRPDGTDETDMETLTDALGPLRLLHLRRDDVVAQAVSWARAEQTGYWHNGDVPIAEPAFDLDQIDELVRTIYEHNAAWRSWFAEQAVRPYAISYEDLIVDPQDTVQGILDHLDIKPPATWRPAWTTARQADEVNAEWIRRYRGARP